MTTSYELKNIKMAGGDETPRFEASIYSDGKKLGIVFNEGCGGPNGYRFHDNADAKAFLEFCQNWGREKKESMTEIDDTWVYEKLDDWEIHKVLVRRSKTKTMFRLKGDAPDAWRSFKKPYSEEMRAYVIKRYGDQIETIFEGVRS